MRLRVAATAVLLAGSVGGCGGDGDDDAAVERAPSAPDAGSAGKTVSALDYVSGVCGALIPFGQGVEASQSTIATKLMSISSVEEGKVLLSELARVLADGSQQMVDGLEAAGTPDVADGERVATAALTAFVSMEEAMAGLQPMIDALDADFSMFPAEAAAILEAAEAAFEKADAGLTELETPELDEASETAPACAEL